MKTQNLFKLGQLGRQYECRYGADFMMLKQNPTNLYNTHTIGGEGGRARTRLDILSWIS